MAVAHAHPTDLAAPGQLGFAAALWPAVPACPPGLRCWNGSDPAARFAVHRNNVISSLVDALGHNFPVVAELVGDDFFRAMAALFVRQSPPRSPVLAHYGEGLAHFIDGFDPARSVPYLADMARLEWAWLRACHAADTTPVAAERLAQALASPQQADQWRLSCHPSLSVIASPFAVASLWRAHQAGDAAAGLTVGDVDPFVPEQVLVLRPVLEVQLVSLPPGAAPFIAALQGGQPLCDAAAEALGAQADFDLQGSLSLLLRHGALTSIHLPRRPLP